MKRYRVVRSGPVFEHPPGEEFTAKIPPEQEKQLIQSGALVIVPKKDKKDAEQPPSRDHR